MCWILQTADFLMALFSFETDGSLQIVWLCKTTASQAKEQLVFQVNK